MKLLLRTLSPLHIGTGEELAPLDYVAYDGQFYRVPQQKFMEFVERKLPDGPNQFAAWVSEKLATMREVRDNRVLAPHCRSKPDRADTSLHRRHCHHPTYKSKY